MRGFTLFEIIIVLSIVTVIVVITAPSMISFLKTQNLNTTTTNILSTLRQAHTQAVFQKNDSSFGVKFLGSSYVLFQGTSYAARTTSEDQSFTVPSSVSVTGINEVVFTKRTGIPSTTGTLLLMAGTKSRSVSINQQGIIEL